MTDRHCFPKAEKLCGKRNIDTLYASGKRQIVWPLRVTYILFLEDDLQANPYLRSNPNFEPRVLVWAPKKLFKHATDRNRVRRLIREAYRLNAQPLKLLCSDRKVQLHIAFNYADKQLPDYYMVEKAMQKCIRKLVDTILAEQTDTAQKD